MASLEMMDHLVIRDRPAIPVDKGRLDHPAHLVIMAMLVNLVTLDHLEILAMVRIDSWDFHSFF